jgi:hypothetical protein
MKVSLYPLLDCGRCGIPTEHRCLGGYQRSTGALTYECIACHSIRQGRGTEIEMPAAVPGVGEEAVLALLKDVDARALESEVARLLRREATLLVEIERLQVQVDDEGAEAEVTRLHEALLGQERATDNVRALLIAARAEIENLQPRTDRADALYAEAVRAWGADAQLDMVVEECAELIVAMQHLLRGRSASTRSVIEELADVTIMAAQARLIVGAEMVDRAIAGKLFRLRERLDEHSVERCRVQSIVKGEG